MRYFSSCRPWFVWIVAGAVLLISAGGALAVTVAYTTTGECEADDGQDWTFNGSLQYRSWDTSGYTAMYDWGYSFAAVLNPFEEAHYVDHQIRYRAAIIYDTSTVVWESSPQSMMDVTQLFGGSGDAQMWNPTPSSWEGSLSNTVVYKVQSAKDDQASSIVARQATLLRNQ